MPGQVQEQNNLVCSLHASRLNVIFATGKYPWTIGNAVCYKDKTTIPIKQTGFLYLYRISNVFPNREILTGKKKWVLPWNCGFTSQEWDAKPPKIKPSVSFRITTQGPLFTMCAHSWEKLSPWSLEENKSRHLCCSSAGKWELMYMMDGMSKRLTILPLMPLQPGTKLTMSLVWSGRECRTWRPCLRTTLRKAEICGTRYTQSSMTLLSKLISISWGLTAFVPSK